MAKANQTEDRNGAELKEHHWLVLGAIASGYRTARQATQVSKVERRKAARAIGELVAVGLVEQRPGRRPRGTPPTYRLTRRGAGTIRLVGCKRDRGGKLK